jgi:hypothetical protein
VNDKTTAATHPIQDLWVLNSVHIKSDIVIQFIFVQVNEFIAFSVVFNGLVLSKAVTLIGRRDITGKTAVGGDNWLCCLDLSENQSPMTRWWWFRACNTSPNSRENSNGGIAHSISNGLDAKYASECLWVEASRCGSRL